MFYKHHSSFRLIFLYNYTFYSRYNTVWIANTEIGLDPNNSVIKRLWCTTVILPGRLMVVYIYKRNESKTIDDITYTE